MNKLSLKIGDYNLNPVLKGKSELPSGGLSDLQNIVKWGTTVLLITAVILTIVFFILGGIGWITSGGDKEKLASARKKIVYATIGFIITLGAFFIVNIVGDFFGIEFF